jgi:hypothetical protein
VFVCALHAGPLWVFFSNKTFFIIRALAANLETHVHNLERLNALILRELAASLLPQKSSEPLALSHKNF